MKTKVLSVMVRLLFLSSLLFNFSVNAQKEKSKEEGFVKLFNGKDFEGWYLKLRSGDAEMAKKIFAIEHEEIHVFNKEFAKEFKLNTGENDTHGLFYSNKKYSNYILRFEHKW